MVKGALIIFANGEFAGLNGFAIFIALIIGLEPFKVAQFVFAVIGCHLRCDREGNAVISLAIYPYTCSSSVR